MIQQEIEEYIKQSLEDDIKEVKMEKELVELVRCGYIPSEVSSWCFLKLKELQAKFNENSTSTCDADVSDTSTEVDNDLFSKSNVYIQVRGQKGICCRAR